MDVTQLTRAHLRIREERARMQREWEEQDQQLRDKQARIEAEMLRLLAESNAESIRTEAGTFYRQIDIVPAGSDWDAFYKWVAAHDAFEALERRIKKAFVKQYMAEHDGALPPGVSVHQRYVARVRTAQI